MVLSAILGGRAALLPLIFPLLFFRIREAKEKGASQMGRKIFILSFLIGLLIILPSCKKKPEETKAADLAKDIQLSDLHLTFVSPKGRTQAPHEAEMIVAVFDQPMIPLEALSENKASLMRIYPAFSGKFRWLNTKTLTFTPKKRFPFSTEIKVTLPAGTKSLQGSELKEDFTWTFRTIIPRLISHLPRSNQKWVRLDPQILLVFNQSLLSEKAKDFLSIIEVSPEKKEASLAFSIDSPSEKRVDEEESKSSPYEVLLIKPEAKLKPEFAYYVGIKAGLPAKEGPWGMYKSGLFKF